MPRKKPRPRDIERLLGLRLRELRRTLKPGVPVQTLSDAAGITATQWRNYERGLSGFPDHQKVRCCEALGCNIEDLFLVPMAPQGFVDRMTAELERLQADVADYKARAQAYRRDEEED